MKEAECPLRHDLENGDELYESVKSQMLEITQRHFPITRKIDTMYKEEHMNAAMLAGCVFNTYATGFMKGARGANSKIGKKLAKLPSIKPPSGEWMRLKFKSMQLGSSAVAFDAEVQRTYQMIRDAGFNLDKWDLAIDIHNIPRYDYEYNENMIRSKPKNGTIKFERYISVQVIVPGMRLVLGVIHMPALTEMGDYVGMLLAKVKDLGIEIGVVMADREFFSVEVLKRFEEMGVRYLVPCRNTGVVKGALDEFADKKRDRASKLWLTGVAGTVQYDAIITRRRKKIKGRRAKDDEYEDIDVFDYNPSEPPHKTYIAFATNDPTINVEEYARRWGIETGFRQIGSARVRTRSENQEARIFCFLYSAMVYNVWVVLNLLSATSNTKKIAKWDGSPEITQMEMKILILFYVLSVFQQDKDRTKEKPETTKEKIYLTLEEIPAG